jgi:hypothetical protein
MESGGECLLAQRNRGILSLKREPGFFAAELILSPSWKAFKREKRFLSIFRGFAQTRTFKKIRS